MPFPDFRRQHRHEPGLHFRVAGAAYFRRLCHRDPHSIQDTAVPDCEGAGLGSSGGACDAADRLSRYLDGRALGGMLANESGNSITLLGLDGKEEVIMRSEIKSLVSSGRSLMPDGLEAAINEQAMADLIAFPAAGGTAGK